jgi:RimJ/RimL family protein N-acetyltransferase
VIRIRRIEPEDGDHLRRIRLAALRDTPSAFASLHAEEVNRSHAKWSELANARATGVDQVTFLAFGSDEVVGIVGGFRPPESDLTIELVSLWTAPWARRTGIAGGLVRALVAWAKTGGAQSVKLWVTEDNDPAIRLYQSSGFALTGESSPLRSGSDEQVQRMSLAIT